MEKTLIRSGVIDGSDSALYLVADAGSTISWIEIINLTVTTAGGAGSGAKFFWQDGMDDGSAIEYIKLAADDSVTMDYIAAGGFSRYATNIPSFGPWRTVTNIGAGPGSTIATANTDNLYDGDVVQFYSLVGAHQLEGAYHWQIDTIVPGVSFDLSYNNAIVAAAAPGADAVYRKVNTHHPFYPKARYIANISQAAQAVVTFTVDHEMVVGQRVQILVPAEFGMTEMHNQFATIAAITNNTITIDIDSTGYTAFAFPVTGDDAFSPCMAIPAGVDKAAVAVDGSTINVADKGIILHPGVHGPAGTAGDELLIRYAITS